MPVGKSVQYFTLVMLLSLTFVNTTPTFFALGGQDQDKEQ